MQMKLIDAQIIKASSPEYDASFILSAASPDRVRDTIDPAAYDLVSKKIKKLIALFNHNHDQPVGFWENLKREKDTLTASIKFAGTNLGKMLKQLIEDGVPLGASIGFRASGSPNELGGIHFEADNFELIETSIVSTPAHPRAVQLAKQYGIDLSIKEIKTATASGDLNRNFPELKKRAIAAVINAKLALKV